MSCVYVHGVKCMGFSIAVDIGTTTVKAILFGEGPKMVQEASKEYQTHYPKPSWAEQAPDDWWNVTVECIRELPGTSGVEPEKIKSRKTIEPVPEWVVFYQGLYQIYKETYQSLKPQFAALARL